MVQPLEYQAMTKAPTVENRKSGNGYRPRRSGRGFHAVSGLIERQVRKSGETRGFAVMKLLTQWESIVGPDTAKVAHPVKISYARDGFGATLTILSSGAQAPMLQAQLPAIQERVNACYGYQAISRIRITQTAPTGFHEGQRAFEHAPPKPKYVADPAIEAESVELVKDIENNDLRTALAQLSENVLSQTTKPKR